MLNLYFEIVFRLVLGSFRTHRKLVGGFFFNFFVSVIRNQPVEVLLSIEKQLHAKYSRLTRSVCRILSNIYDRVFSNISKWLLAVNYFAKKGLS